MTDHEFIQGYRDLKKRIEQLESVVGKIKAESEPEFERAEQDENYYSIVLDDACYVKNRLEQYYAVDDRCYNLLNYFRTNERAQEVRGKIKFLLKLERFHDIYCPDYKPNWEETSEHKYCVFYDSVDNKYYAGWRIRRIPQPDVFFPTEEIAQQVCDRLNKECEEHDNS